MVFKLQLLSLFRRCLGCGQEIKLETSIVGTMFILACIELANTANNRGHGSW